MMVFVASPPQGAPILGPSQLSPLGNPCQSGAHPNHQCRVPYRASLPCICRAPRWTGHRARLSVLWVLGAPTVVRTGDRENAETPVSLQGSSAHRGDEILTFTGSVFPLFMLL